MDDLNQLHVFLADIDSRSIAVRNSVLTDLSNAVRALASPDTWSHNLQVLTKDRIAAIQAPFKTRLAASLAEPLLEKTSDLWKLSFDIHGIKIWTQHSPYVQELLDIRDTFLKATLPYSNSETIRRSWGYFVDQIRLFQIEYLDRKISWINRKIALDTKWSLNDRNNEKSTILLNLQKLAAKWPYHKEKASGKQKIIPFGLWWSFENSENKKSSIVEYATGGNIWEETGVNVQTLLSFIFSDNLDWFWVSRVFFLEQWVLYWDDDIMKFQKANRIYKKFFNIWVISPVFDEGKDSKYEANALVTAFKSDFIRILNESITRLIPPELYLGSRKFYEWNREWDEFCIDGEKTLQNLFPKTPVSLPSHPMMPHKDASGVWEHLTPVFIKLQNPISFFVDTIKVIPLKRPWDIACYQVEDATMLAWNRMSFVTQNSYFKNEYLKGYDWWQQLIFCHDIENVFHRWNEALPEIIFQMLLTIYRLILIYGTKAKNDGEASKIFSQRCSGAKRFLKCYKGASKSQQFIDIIDHFAMQWASWPQSENIALAYTFAHFGTRILTNKEEEVPEEFKAAFAVFTSLALQ